MARKRRKPPLTRHHIIARSRLPSGIDKNKDNVVILPGDFHAAWHVVADVLTVEEVHRFIDMVMCPGAVWTQHGLHELRQLIMRGYVSEAA